MESPDLHCRIVSILSDVFQVQLSPSIENLSQHDLEEWDSFNHLRLVDELEVIFQISLDDEDIPEMTSLQQVKALLQRYGVGDVQG